jgi:cytochrome oxidase Cu insertion factor (SCO1/SenC/PrrC family)
VALAIFAVCAAPLAAAPVSYHFFPPAGRTNYGELVAAKPLPPVRVARLDGRPFSLADLQGKWVMLQADEAACGKPCQAKLYGDRLLTTGNPDAAADRRLLGKLGLEPA